MLSEPCYLEAGDALGSGLLALVVILVLASLPVVAAAGLAIYGPQVFAWGFREHPRITWLIICALIAAILFAALTYSYFFPQCHPLGFNWHIWVCNKQSPALQR